MIYSLGLVAVLLTFVSTAQCIDFSTIFGWHKKSISRYEATTSDCKIFENRRTCKFSSKSLKFDDVTNALTVQLDVSDGGRTIKCDKTLTKENNYWYGTCDGDADDANFVTRVDTNGKESVFGSIHVGNDICHISPNILGEEQIECIPKTEFKAEDDPPSVPKGVSPNKDRMLTSDASFGFVPAVDQSKSQSVLRGYNHNELGRELLENAVSKIDILVVWTKLAECGKAGLLPDCIVDATTENIMRGLIDLAIAETNTAYELSGIFASLRLVHAYRDPDYIEGNDMYTSLDHITNEADGAMDSVHSKRVLYGADVVHLISGGTSSCGIAWSGNPTIDYMFGVTRYSCATGVYSFGHEIGHNFGMFHDRGSEKTCSESTTFNYGYRDPNAAFRTILAYDCKVGECDAMPKQGCTRIPRFSNSNTTFTYNGKPIGDAQRDNAKQFNNERARVASFFPAMNCQRDIECTDNNSNTVDTCNVNSRVCVFSPVKAPYASPVRVPSKAPTASPVRVPSKAPTNAPVNAVSNRPIPSPTSAPIFSTAPVTQPQAIPVSPVTQPQAIPVSPVTRPQAVPVVIKTPTVSPTVFVEPIEGEQEPSGGFFAMLLRFISQLFSFSWLFN